MSWNSLSLLLVTKGRPSRLNVNEVMKRLQEAEASKLPWFLNPPQPPLLFSAEITLATIYSWWIPWIVQWGGTIVSERSFITSVSNTALATTITNSSFMKIVSDNAVWKAEPYLFLTLMLWNLSVSNPAVGRNSRHSPGPQLPQSISTCITFCSFAYELCTYLAEMISEIVHIF